MINPLLRLDYPDPDVIRVGDTYYMVSTTMYFMPGCEILRSYDLINWEHAAFVYDYLDSTPAQKLENGQNIYSRGMWAASLRYHEGRFYVMFVCNDTRKTYLYTADSIEGPWKKSYVEGFYHDCSLLFEDGRVFVVYGNRTIHLTELKADLSGPKEGGLNRVVVRDSDEAPLGYEGTHFYKINGKYYLFFIHSLVGRCMRAEACFVSDSLEGEFTGGDVFVDDIGYCGQGVAQGGIVDTPEGDWYAILFQDRGAVGRIPVLVPVKWEGDQPVFCTDRETLLNPVTVSTRPGYVYEKLADSDDFSEGDGPSFGLRSIWQFNHEPDLSLVELDTKAKTWSVRSGSLSDSVTQAKNTITQRLYYPGTHCEVTVDASGIKEGDYAGLAVLQTAYGFVAVTRRDGDLYLVMQEKTAADGAMTSYQYTFSECAAVKLDSPVVRLSFDADFTDMRDEVRFQIGPSHKMYFKLDTFTGNRAGLFLCSTKETGGKAVFSDFVLNETCRG
ncbi:MAG: family 43 glycosylhydrolase [Clostridiales bacterium]|nr:family 43 glycosylhydrolase [Candidatus Blautia equi]